MRVRALLFLSLLAASRSPAAVLAEAGPLHFGDGGADALKGSEAADRRSALDLSFTLVKATVVEARAEGLKYLRLDPNAAPEVFMDDQYLGPLLPEHGRDWRSPRSLELGPGTHHLLLRNAQVADAEDFVLKRIFVYASQPSGDAVPAAAPAPARPAAENGCAKVQRRDWPADLKAGITLSVLNGRTIGTGSLVGLVPGDQWVCGIKVSSDRAPTLALEAGFQPLSGTAARWLLSLSPEPPEQVDAVGYKPGNWERLRVKFCDSDLYFQFASAPAMKVHWPHDRLDLEIASQNVEITLRPVP